MDALELTLALLFLRSSQFDLFVTKTGCLLASDPVRPDDQQRYRRRLWWRSKMERERRREGDRFKREIEGRDKGERGW